MKKTMIIITVFVFAMGFIACSDYEELTDKEKIVDRIETLEDAINSGSYDDFHACLHGDSNQYNTFVESQFNSYFSGDTYDFHDLTITITGSQADVDCSTTINAINEYVTYFDMRVDGDDWYVYKWTQETDTIFDRYSVGQ